ncbi:MAG: hypothetical protein AAGA60_30120 [Cyanobacteria bacterium P01_E01_bin.42]
MPALNCLPQSPNRPTQNPLPQRGNQGGGFPFRNPIKPILGLPLPFPSFSSPSKKPARAHTPLGDIARDAFGLPDPRSDRPGDSLAPVETPKKEPNGEFSAFMKPGCKFQVVAKTRQGGFGACENFAYELIRLENGKLIDLRPGLSGFSWDKVEDVTHSCGEDRDKPGFLTKTSCPLTQGVTSRLKSVWRKELGKRPQKE